MFDFAHVLDSGLLKFSSKYDDSGLAGPEGMTMEPQIGSSVENLEREMVRNETHRVKHSR